MRVFRPIIEPMPNLLAIDVADLAHRRGIGGKPVGDDAARAAIFLHDALEKLQRRSLVPLRPDHRFQFVIDRPPEIAELAVDLHKDLIQMPTPLGEAAHVRYPPLSDLGGEHRAKPVPPKSDSLMADVDPPLGQQILDVAQRQRVPDVHHHDQTDHFWRAVEISKRVAHGPKLPQPEAARKIGLTLPVHAAATTPAQRMGVLVAHTRPSVSAFPETTIGSACTSSFSRFAQRSLTLRPAHSRGHQIRDRYPKASDISSPPCLPRLLPAGAVAGWALHPLEMRRLVTAHVESGHLLMAMPPCSPWTPSPVWTIMAGTFRAASMDVGDWLRSLGLGQYEAAFRENAIDGKVLPRLTAEDLKDMGVVIVGHRRTMLSAIEALSARSEPL